MPINILRGDAVPTRKILAVGPPPEDQVAGTFEFEVTGSGKYFSVAGWSPAAIVAAWPRTIPEFGEITPTVAGGGYTTGTLILTGPSDGTPFSVTVRAAATGAVTVTTTTEGALPRNEVQRISLPASADGGTFTVTFSGQTTAATDFDATAAELQAALEALSNIAPGDVAVTQVSAGVWDVEFRATYAAIEVAEMTIDASSLTVGDAGSAAVSTSADGTPKIDTVVEIAFDYSIYKQFRLRFAGGGGATELFSDPVFVDDPTDGTSTAAEVKTVIEGLLTDEGWATSSVVSVTNPATGVYVVTLLGAENPDGYAWTYGTQPAFSVFLGTAGSLQAGGLCATLTYGVDAQNETQLITITGEGGGTYTLTYDGQTTGSIARAAAPSAVKTAIEALSNVTTVVVSGTPGVSYTVTFLDPGNEDLDEMTITTSFTPPGVGAGSVVETVAHYSGLSEVQTITLSPSVSGGTFTLSYDGDRSAAIAFDAAGSAVDTALEGIEEIGSGGVTVLKLGERSWRVTYTDKADKLALVPDASGLTVTADTDELVRLLQAAAGPTHANDPLNWTLLRVPESGDEVWLDQPNLPLLHSLRWRTGFSLGDHEKDTLLADGAMHFAEGQKITLRTTGTLPGGLAAQDYYVRDPQEHHRTFKLATTRTGDPVDLTSSAGSGAHTALVELDSIHPAARFSGPAGLPRRNPLGYFEYRPQYWSFGMRPSGAELVKIGEGDGPGSGRLKFDLGTDRVDVETVQTGGGLESGVSACLILNTHEDSTFTQEDGDSGIAAFPGETAEFGSFVVRGGNVFTGEGVTLNGPIRARRGTVFGRYVDSAGVEHRWD